METFIGITTGKMVVIGWDHEELGLEELRVCNDWVRAIATLKSLSVCGVANKQVLRMGRGVVHMVITLEEKNLHALETHDVYLYKNAVYGQNGSADSQAAQTNKSRT
eukprot:4244834-Prymnesium_polylepis.1